MMNFLSNIPAAVMIISGTGFFIMIFVALCVSITKALKAIFH
jgi:hypothetical protein